MKKCIYGLSLVFIYINLFLGARVFVQKVEECVLRCTFVQKTMAFLLKTTSELRKTYLAMGQNPGTLVNIPKALKYRLL